MWRAPIIPPDTTYLGGGTRTQTAHERADKTRYLNALEDVLEGVAVAMRCDCAQDKQLATVLDAVQSMVDEAMGWKDARA